MNDLISRQAAIETMSDMRCEVNCFDRDERKTYETLNRVIRALTVLPSAQPEQIARDIATIIENEQDMRVILKNAEYTETHSCDCERTETHKSRREWYMKGYRDAQNAAMHESCTDCPLYDHDKHNCPRFNKVIPRAIEGAMPRWIPIKWHDCTAEEREEYGFGEEIATVFDCEMPSDNQEILVTTSHGYVEKDVCYIDDGFSLDSGYDWIEDITAWMPLPEPYA